MSEDAHNPFPDPAVPTPRFIAASLFLSILQRATDDPIHVFSYFPEMEKKKRDHVESYITQLAGSLSRCIKQYGEDESLAAALARDEMEVLVSSAAIYAVDKNLVPRVKKLRDEFIKEAQAKEAAAENTYKGDPYFMEREFQPRDLSEEDLRPQFDPEKEYRGESAYDGEAHEFKAEPEEASVDESNIVEIPGGMTQHDVAAAFGDIMKMIAIHLKYETLLPGSSIEADEEAGYDMDAVDESIRENIGLWLSASVAEIAPRLTGIPISIDARRIKSIPFGTLGPA